MFDGFQIQVNTNWDKTPNKRQVMTHYQDDSLFIIQGVYREDVEGFIITCDIVPAIKISSEHI